MPLIERSSPRAATAGCPCGGESASRVRHFCREYLPRHPHGRAFAAVVLSGSYVEAGDTGLHRLTPGDVLFHAAWERHLDRVGHGGAEVLVLELRDEPPFLKARIDDPDAIARSAESDVAQACELLLAVATPSDPNPADWPELLAAALREDPGLSLRRWAADTGLRASSVSRGFRQVFGTTPQRYRLSQRFLRAATELATSSTPISSIASEQGFADQAHLNRTFRSMSDATPLDWRRRSAPSVAA